MDRFEYESPLGVLGKVADVLFLERHVRRLLQRRAQFMKELAEATKAADA